MLEASAAKPPTLKLRRPVYAKASVPKRGLMAGRPEGPDVRQLPDRIDEVELILLRPAGYGGQSPTPKASALKRG
jgi:hypothetical protein